MCVGSFLPQISDQGIAPKKETMEVFESLSTVLFQWHFSLVLEPLSFLTVSIL